MKNNTEWEIVELFRNEETNRVFIHLRNPLNDLVKSYELVDLPEEHSTSYSTRAERAALDSEEATRRDFSRSY